MSKMRFKVLLSLALATGTTTVFAQDVIVKHDGSTILSKVTEIGVTEVKYKKFSNQNGPTYSILKSDIQAINYESGEKETFADVSPATSSNANNSKSTPFGVNPNLEEDNLKLVREFNSHDPVYLRDDTHKNQEETIKILGIKEGSIIETPELKASFAMKIWYGKVKVSGQATGDERTLDLGEDCPYYYCNEQYKIIISLKNKTNKPIYIDLANSYILQNEQAKPYYVPTVTSTTQGGSSGGSVNLGAITGALGVGGTIGRLANGVSVGGSNSNVNTKTTYSQRIVSIPPMSSLALDPMEIGEGWTKVAAFGRWEKQAAIQIAYNSYFKELNFKETKVFNRKEYSPKGLKRGEKIDIPPLDNVNPLGAYITYSFDEAMSAIQSMRIDFYLRQIMGVRLNVFKDIDFSQCPLIFK
ncbi:MAG: hypothetical protein IJ155_05935 [Prevotella sp.]|nr:hypothetical protein [Prevotella sp.]